MYPIFTLFVLILIYWYLNTVINEESKRKLNKSIFHNFLKGCILSMFTTASFSSSVMSWVLMGSFSEYIISFLVDIPSIYGDF